ncbi:MAG: glycosyltransferase [bacterium]
MSLKIWKPGAKLRELLQSKGDVTTFGGMSELRYCVDYLGAEPIDGAEELRSGDTVLINNCNPSFHGQAEGLIERGVKIFQMVSDLNLVIPDSVLGPHLKLTQIPQSDRSDFLYAGFEGAVVLYLLDHSGETKALQLVYGGGKRDGSRDIDYLDYLNPENAYVSAIVSSSPVFGEGPKMRGRLTFNELQELYAQAKYGLVISDPSYYEAGMLSQRYWEYCLNGMVAFTDRRYDRFEVLMKADDFRRVSGHEELAEKIGILEKNERERLELVEEQKAQVEGQRKIMKARAEELKDIIAK